MKRQLLGNILMRILATFAASGLSVIGAGAIADVPLWKACFMAGIAGVATVIEGLSRAFLDDGKLTLSEVNNVFQRFDKKTEVSDEEVEKRKEAMVNRARGKKASIAEETATIEN
jgi:hypothetical protein